MAWVVRGSFVLDRLFNENLAADVDVFFEGNMPSVEEVAGALNCPPGRVSIYEGEFEEKVNIDNYRIKPDNRIYRGARRLPATVVHNPLRVTQVDRQNYISSSDCIRLLKTKFKYQKHLTMSQALENRIIRELRECSNDENMAGDIVNCVLAVMPQDTVYDQMWVYLNNTCKLPGIVMAELPDMRNGVAETSSTDS